MFAPSPDGNAKSATIWHRCHESAQGRIDRRADNRDLRVGSVSLRFQGIRTLEKAPIMRWSGDP